MVYRKLVGGLNLIPWTGIKRPSEFVVIYLFTSGLKETKALLAKKLSRAKQRLVKIHSERKIFQNKNLL